MIYTIYKITNIINNKIYVGKHQTNDLNDDYMGSGKRLKQAINKYGIENFKKEILFIFYTEEEMNRKEAEIVTEEFCLRNDTYNICVGGKGGFSYINTPEILNSEKRQDSIRKWNQIGREKHYNLLETNEEYKNKCNSISNEHLANARMSLKEKFPNGAFFGKTHTEETKEKMKLSKKNAYDGIKNSQYGTMWITDGYNNKKIKKDDPIPDGWSKGRKYT